MPPLTLAESVAAALRDLLVGGHLVCGDRLVEIALAREMAVSQNTVRDALRLLEHEGWVIKQPRRGVTVRAFSRDEAAEVYALLAAVEGVALDWAMDRMTRTRLMELGKLLVRARRAAPDDSAAAIQALFDFHERLMLHTSKALTTELMQRLYNYARLLEALRQTRSPHDNERLAAQVAGHERLYRLIESGDRAGAQAALHSLFSAYCEMVFPILEAS